MAKDGSLSVRVGGTEWLTSGGAWVMTSGGRVSSSADGTLSLRSVSPLSGSDAAGGRYTGSVAKWAAADGTPYETSVRVYASHAVFAQRFPAGVANASAGQGDEPALCQDGWPGWCKRDGLVSGFPLLRLAGTTTRGVVSFQGLMAGWATQVGTWSPQTGAATPTPPKDPVGTCRVVVPTGPGSPKGVRPDADAYNTARFTAFVPSGPKRGDGPDRQYSAFTRHVDSYCDCHLETKNCSTSKTGSGGTCGEWAYTDPWSKLSDCRAHCGAMNCSCFDHRPGVGAGLIGSGIEGSGPLLLFSPSPGPSLVLSAGSQFMAASQVFGNGTLAYGVMGAVTSIPAGYTLETVLSVSPAGGVNRAMEEWGDVLLAAYGKERYAYRRDLAVRQLGYSTDNGAFYYYNTEANKTSERTLVDVQKNAEAQGVPYSYVLLDSWWYYKGPGAGVTLWDARPDVFPGGLAGFHEKTGWPTMLHNRMWSPHTNYSTANGGQYTFIHDGSDVAVPNDQRFWDDLIANKSRAGMFCYEQDWLNSEMDKSRTLGESATMGRTWMQQMNDGCAKANVTIQLCMSHVRHILQSVEMPAATNCRASGDYIHPGPGGGHQWDIGVTSILAHAVGLAPSKDNYWSRETMQGNGYGEYGYEPHSRLQSAVLSFSAGPVAPSDEIGGSDTALIMKACDASGRLLSPDKPATLSDASFVRQAFPEARGADGQLWTTHATVNGSRYAYVLAPELAENYSLSVAEMGYSSSEELIAVRPSETPSDSSGGWISPPETTAVANHAPLEVRACTPDDFELVLLAPKLAGGWYLLGEPSKWVSVSSQRFTGVVSDAASVAVSMTGKAGEAVTVALMTPAAGATSAPRLLQQTCKVGASGKASLRVMAEEGQESGWKATCKSEWETETPDPGQ